MIDEPWGVAKFLDFLKHIWMPLVILGFESSLHTRQRPGPARQPFVTTARPRACRRPGCIKYPIRMAAPVGIA